MDFKTAAATKLTFKNNQTIDEIAKTDAGLLELDRLRGAARTQWLKDTLDAYLDDPTIAKELKLAMERRR